MPLRFDLGGLGISSSAVWPVTPIGAVRLARAIPQLTEVDVSAFVGPRVGIPGANYLAVLA